MKSNKKRSAFFRLIGYTKFKWYLYYPGLFGFAFISLAFNYVFAMAFKDLTDAALSGDMGNVVHNTIWVLIKFGFLLVGNSFFLYLLYANAKKIGANLRKILFEHIQRLPMGYIENQHSGDLISRLNSDMGGAAWIYGDPFNMVLRSAITGIGSGVVIFTLNWKLGIITVVLGAFNIVINIFFVKPLKEISVKIQKTLSNLNQRFSDSLVGIHIIKIFNLKDIIFEKYEKESVDVRRKSMKRVKLNTRLNGVNTFMGYMNYSGMIVIGSIMIVNGQLTIGTLVAITELTGSIFYMFRSFGEFITRAQACLACAERIFEVLDTPAEDQVHAMTKASMVKRQNEKDRPAIEFENIAFGYNDQVKVLGDFSLKVYKGQVVAVVGSSGSGKSTLFKLLLNFYEQTEGEIRLFSKAFFNYEQKELRKLIAYVPQDNYLFNGTIKENIAFGKPGAAEEEIINAAKAAYAHDFITKLPKGYDTEVGERGTHLSGGEKQRVAIARALLKDAPILLLDEATSSLDSESEQQIQRALEVLMQGRTTMVVAHRLSTIQNADRILVIDDGNICEDGKHDELLSLDKVYAQLYNMQFKDVEGAVG